MLVNPQGAEMDIHRDFHEEYSESLFSSSIELPANGSHKDEPELIVTKEQAKQWLADAGFKPIQDFDGLAEGKWFVVYAR